MPKLRELDPTAVVIDRSLFFNPVIAYPNGGAVLGMCVLRGNVLTSTLLTPPTIWYPNVFYLDPAVRPFVVLGAFITYSVSSIVGQVVFSLGTGSGGTPTCLLSDVTVAASTASTRVWGTREADYTGTYLSPGGGTKFAAVRGLDPVFGAEIDSDGIQLKVDLSGCTSWTGQVQAFLLGFPLTNDFGE